MGGSLTPSEVCDMLAAPVDVPRAGPPWSSNEVAEIVGISYRQLDYWLRVGLIDPMTQATGSGTRRRFDNRDVADVRLAALLMSVRHDTFWAGHVIDQVACIGIEEWGEHLLVIQPDGTAEIDGTVTTVAVVINLGSLVDSPESVAA